MGIRGGPRSLPQQVLLDRYEAVTSAVRKTYLRVLGLG
jgi:hypothetical protein